MSKYLAIFSLAAALDAQSLTITNARIVDGTGRVIERGSVVIRDGKIVSVGEGKTSAGKVIDAKGMTVMPGFIDAHRHVIQGDPNAWMKDLAVQRMQEFLDGGFTTVLSCGDPLEQILALRGKLAKGEVKGPRLYAAGRIPLARAAGGGGGGVDPARIDISRPPDRPTKAALAIPRGETLAAIQNLVKAGVDAFKTVIITTPGGPETATLALVASEARKLGIPSITHAVTVVDTLAAVEAKTDVLVHTPHIGMLEGAEVKKIVDSKIPMMSTLGIFVPTFAEGNARIRARTGDDNLPRFRDLDPFPMNTILSGGQGPVNARLLWEAGMVYGYGTDTTFRPADSLAQELKPLRLMFSNKDIVKIMTQNAAAVIGRSKDLGTLEPGKIADITVIDGNPLDDLHNVLKVRMVLKEGNVMVDRLKAR